MSQRRDLLRTFSKRLAAFWLPLVAGGMLLAASDLSAQVCATPGADGTSFARNTYFPGAASVAAGASTVTIGAARVDANASTTDFALGDLALIIQMQDAQINNTDTDAYGDGIAGGVANGSTDLRSAGRYEYKLVTGIAAGSVTFATPLAFSYTQAGADANNGVRRFQVIRVPQFATLTLPGGTLNVTTWDGSTGGVFALDVSAGLDLNSTTVNADVVGFRGGGGQETTVISGSNQLSFRAAQAAGTPAANLGAAKGEGIAGTPRFIRAVNNPYSGLDLVTSGYPSIFDLARGAPGNAGGGGTQHNSGGGGGGNVGAGGRGGRSFGVFSATNTGPTCISLVSIIGGGVTYFSCGGDGSRDVGGYGGFGISPPSGARIFLGGGGGAGDSNNSNDNNAVAQNAGGNGGGLIFVRARTIAGTGTLSAVGQAGLPAGRDGGGGGGAGGTVVVITESASIPGLTADARGGNGGNSGEPLRSNETQGTGGGGGGGAVLLSPGLTIGSSNIAGGIPGINQPVANRQNTFGASAGLGGVADVPFAGGEFPNPSSCYPALTVTKSTTTPSRVLPADTTAQYVITVSNASGGGAASGVAVSDLLPVPFQYAGGAVSAALTGAVGPNPAPASGTATLIIGTAGGTVANSYRILPGGSVQFTAPVNLNGAGVGTYQNPANVSYSDPSRLATGQQTATPGGAYATVVGAVPGSNYAAASTTNEDVTLVGSTDLRVVKTNSTGTLESGATTSYTLTVTNLGTFAADGAVITDIPSAGLSLQSVTCGSAAGGAVCPAGLLTVAALTGAGIVIPTLPAGGSVTFTVTALVTATGL